jgi:CRP/FNR family transcriptional regulator, cyclic AMP receptor protein
MQLASMPVVEAVPPGSFLATLSEDDRDALRSAGRQRHYRRSSWIFREGDRGDFVLLVLEGRVKLAVTTTGGGTSILSIRGPGELVGELAAIDAGPRLAGAVALDNLVARAMTSDEFRALATQHPSLMLALLRMLTTRLRESDRRRIEFGTSDASSRLAKLLVDLASDEPDPREAKVHLSQEEIAAMIGVSRESTARALAGLRREGLVATRRRVVKILDVDGLREFAR